MILPATWLLWINTDPNWRKNLREEIIEKHTFTLEITEIRVTGKRITFLLFRRIKKIILTSKLQLQSLYWSFESVGISASRRPGGASVEGSKKKNESKVWSNLYGDLIYTKPGKPEFSISDKVRISKYKRQVFDKGYTPNWQIKWNLNEIDEIWKKCEFTF